jgi:electron transfer flavoprotein alpha subunit
MSVLVYTENWDGKFKKVTFELVSYAAGIAKMMGTTVTAVSIGKVDSDELRNAGKYGADKVLSVSDGQLAVLDNQAYAAVIAEVAGRENSKVIVLANNNTGKAVAPRLAVRMKAGIGSGVNRLPVSLEPFTVYKRAYSGNAYAKMEIRSDVKIITLAQNSFDITDAGKDSVY